MCLTTARIRNYRLRGCSFKTHATRRVSRKQGCAVVAVVPARQANAGTGKIAGGPEEPARRYARDRECAWKSMPVLDQLDRADLGGVPPV